MRALEKLFNVLASVPHDKLAHAAWSVPLYIGLALLSYRAPLPLAEHPFESALLIGWAVAPSKEGYDWLYNRFVAPIHEVSWWDALSSCVGISAAYVCTLLPRVLPLV